MFGNVCLSVRLSNLSCLNTVQDLGLVVSIQGAVSFYLAVDLFFNSVVQLLLKSSIGSSGRTQVNGSPVLVFVFLIHWIWPLQLFF